MAAGDEKIDVFDQVRIKNRLIDAPVEIMFAGINYRWEPQQVRSIPRAYSAHFLNKSTYKWDPTEQNYPGRTLVLIDEKGEAVETGAPVADLTMGETAVLDLIDDEHLPDRYFDPETGVALRNKEGRVAGVEHRHFRGRGVSGPKIAVRKPEMIREVADAINAIPEPE